MRLSFLKVTLKTLDRVRARILRRSLRISALKHLFLHRPARLGVYFGIATILNLALALKFPLWVLLLGPLAWGVPHLLAVIRYVPRLTLPQPPHARVALGITTVFSLMALYRLYIPFETPVPFAEIGVGTALIGALFFGLSSTRRKAGVRAALGLFAISITLLAGIHAWPTEALMALLLVHNGVGFYYWIMRSSSSSDRRVAVSASLLFLAACATVLLGAADALFAPPSSALWEIGQQIFAELPAHWMKRLLITYAFGQGLHYFVWLKAIPELELPTSYPVSFSRSFALFRQELGVSAGLLALAAAGGLIFIAAFLTLQEARNFYLAASAFHGFFEIAALPFVRRAQSTADSHSPVFPDIAFHR